MNVGNILKVADAIEQASVPGLGFNMARYVSTDGFADLSGHECGTTACIAGWACVLDGTAASALEGMDGSVCYLAMEVLGLDQSVAIDLFVPDNYETDEIAPEHAVRCLRNLAITGKVDWEAAMKGDEPVLPPLPVSKAVAKAGA